MTISGYDLTVDTAFTPPKVTVVPKPVAQWYVSGRTLMTPTHKPFRPVGVEIPVFAASWYDYNQYINEAAAAGVNTIRVIPYIKHPAPAGTGGVVSTAELNEVIWQIEDAGLLADVAVDGGAYVDSWLDSGVSANVIDEKAGTVVHAKGEGQESTGLSWSTNAKSVISQLRAKGYTQPLYILSNTYGRNLPTILQYGPGVLASDPLKSVVFGWQAYWGSSNYYQNLYGMTVDQGIQKAYDSGLCIQVGVMEHTDPGTSDTLNVSAVISKLNTLNMGWLWWDWRLGPDNIGYGTYKDTPVAQYVKGFNGFGKAVKF